MKRKKKEYHHPDLDSLVVAAERDPDWRDWVGKHTTLYHVLTDREKKRSELDLGI